MLQDGDDLVRHAFGIAISRAFPNQPLQRLLRRQAGDRGLLRILIGEFGKREPAALSDFERARQRLRIAAE
jgi:hypothetical protein